MAQKVRVGFIGTGGIGRYQAAILAKMQDVELVAGADVSEAALKAFQKEHPQARAFSDYRQMLVMDGLDAVSVCTPNCLHKEPTIAALRAGKDVMVEKPMAMNAAEARAMVEAARQTGRRLVIGFQYRLSPQAQALKRFVDAGDIGQPLFVRVQALGGNRLML